MIRRVLMTADTVGGVWTYSLDLARALGEYGIEVALATMGRPMSPDQATDARTISNLEVFESDFKLEWMEEPWRDVKRAGRWLLSLQDAVRPDVIHLNGYCHASLRWSVPTVVVCHSCVLSWWQAVKGEPAGPEWERYRSEVKLGLASSKLVVAPTRAMLNEANRLYGPFKRSRVIANACDSRRFSPGEKEPIVFSAGRLWDEAKNVRALDEIAGDLPWPVYVAGDGESKEPVSGAKRLGRLHSEELAKWLARASIYALPARYEPFGLSVLEAARSGCALVLGDIPSLRENWEDCALFVDPRDPAALREAIERLIGDPGLRQRLATEAIHRACAFTPYRFAESYVDAYQDLVHSERRRLSLEGRILLV